MKAVSISGLMIALFVSAGLGLIGPVAAQTIAPRSDRAPMSKDSYTLATTKAEAQYTVDKEACAPLSEKGGSAAHRDTTTERTEARSNASAERREAAIKVANEKCDSVTTAANDDCPSNPKMQ